MKVELAAQKKLAAADVGHELMRWVARGSEMPASLRGCGI